MCLIQLCYMDNKKIEPNLTEIELKYREVIDSLLIPIAINDKNHNITFLNRKFIEIFGYTTEDIPNLSLWWQKAYPDLEYRKLVSETWQSRVGEAKKTNKDFSPMEVNIKTKDGKTKRVIVSANFLNNHAGNFHLVILNDITENKKVEETLQANKLKCELALRSAHMGVWIFDLIENKRFFDTQTCALLGIDPETFSGSEEEFYSVVHPDDRNLLKVALVNTIDSGVMYEPEYKVIWPNGEIRNITARAELIRDDMGKPKMINGIIWDITEHKKVEIQLEQKAVELQKVNQIMIGRELKMIELKKEILNLKEELEKLKKS